MHIGESTLQYASEENNGCAPIAYFCFCDETRLGAFCLDFKLEMIGQLLSPFDWT
jgi:hypothetical protein